MEEIKQKIAELQRQLDQLKAQVENKKPLKITQWPNKDNDRIYINGDWVASLFDDNNAHEPDGAIIYLNDCDGRWTTEKGVEILGYLYYYPNEK